MSSAYIHKLQEKEATVRDALEDLQKTQNEKNVLNQQRSDDAYKNALKVYSSDHLGQDNFNESDIELAFLSVEHAIELSSKPLDAFKLKGKLLILKGDYQGALMIFEKVMAHKYTNALTQLLNKNTDDPAEIFNDIKTIGDDRLTRLFISKVTFGRYPLDVKARFAKLALMYLNNVDELHFVYSEDNHKLDISNNETITDLYPIRRLRLKIININGCKQIRSLAYFKDLPLRKVFASGTAIDDRNFRYLESKVINELDISFCEINRLVPLYSMPLKHLNIRGISKEKLGHISKLNKDAHIRCSVEQLPVLEEMNIRYERNWQLETD